MPLQFYNIEIFTMQYIQYNLLKALLQYLEKRQHTEKHKGLQVRHSSSQEIKKSTKQFLEEYLQGCYLV